MNSLIWLRKASYDSLRNKINLLVSGWRIPFGRCADCCDKSTGTWSGPDVPGTLHWPPLVSPPPGPPPGGPPYDNGWPPVFKPSDKPSYK